jgi:hypothetical protein
MREIVVAKNGAVMRCYREPKTMFRAFLDLTKANPLTGVAVEGWLTLANKKKNRSDIGKFAS